MRDPYSVLELGRTAGAGEIKAAYRRLAKTWHPDRNRGDGAARERFAEIVQAYEILGHRGRRAAFDRGEIDASGRPLSFAARRAKAREAAPDKAENTANPFAATGVVDDDILERIFGEAARRAHVADAPGIDDIPLNDKPSPRAADGAAPAADRPAAQSGDAEPAAASPAAEAAPARNGGGLRVRSLFDALNALFNRGRGDDDDANAPPEETGPAFLDVMVPLSMLMNGGTAEAVLADGRRIDIPVAKGTTEGSRVSVTAPAKGASGEPLSVVAAIRIAAGERFWTDGADLHGELALPLADAVLGGKVEYETLDGRVALTVPAWSGSDRVLRLKERGLPRASGGRGDLHVHLRLTLPETPDQKLIDLMTVTKHGFYV